MRLSNDCNPSHRFSLGLDDRKGPSRVSSRLNDDLPKDKKSFLCLKGRLESQRDKELNMDTGDPEIITFLKYGVRRDYIESSLPKSVGEFSLFNEKLNCSIKIPANQSFSLIVNLPKDLNQGRLKDRIPEEKKCVLYNHDLNSLKKPPFGVVTEFPDDPNPVFNSPSASL